MATKTTAKSSKTAGSVRAAAYGMFALGLGLSVTHTVDFFHTTLGAGIVSAIAAPVFIDGIQIIGKLGRSRQFAEATRKTGFKVQMFGAILSLIANVIAGPTVGDKILGVVFVGGYIFAEWFAENLKPASDDHAAEVAAKRAAAAAKAQATRKANAQAAAEVAAAKQAATKARRTRKAQTAQLEADLALTTDDRAYI